MIHGGPGTGKSTVIEEYIRQAISSYKYKPKILVTAPSNVAVDNLLLKLSNIPTLKLLRLGHPNKVNI